MEITDANQILPFRPSILTKSANESRTTKTAGV